MESFPPPSLFRIADFEVDVVAIFEFLVEVALKSNCTNEDSTSNDLC